MVSMTTKTHALFVLFSKPRHHHQIHSVSDSSSWFVAGPILERKGMRAIFQKKRKKGQKKGKIKFWQKCTKFENILKKGSLMRAIIARMKQLEYVLSSDWFIADSNDKAIWSAFPTRVIILHLFHFTILHTRVRSSKWVDSWFTPQTKRLRNISSNLSPIQSVQIIDTI